MIEQLTEVSTWYSIRLPDGNLVAEAPGPTAAGASLLRTSEDECVVWSSVLAAEDALRLLRGHAEHLGMARAFEAAKIVVFAEARTVVEVDTLDPAIEIIDVAAVR